ncbi:MAG TPA: hypothetical protein VJK08_01405, partial [Patescibacteria group bacterium]|nr:hypothetical protein [Patescibacteria group bacterium]
MKIIAKIKRFKQDFVQKSRLRVSKDTKEIQALAQEETEYIKKAKKLDQTITMIQRSTKTLLPFMAPAHNYLRMKFGWYYHWHTSPYASATHWTLLFVFALTFFANIFVYGPGTIIFKKESPKVFAVESYYEQSTPTELSTATSLAAKDTSKTLEPKKDKGEKELIDRRTATANSFLTADGKIRLSSTIGPINYKNNPDNPKEPFKQIDLTIDKTDGQPWQYAMEHNGYQARFWTSRAIKGEDVKYVAQYRQNGQWLEMAPVSLQWENDKGEIQVISKPLTVSDPTVDNTNYTITWANAFGDGIDF